MRALAWALFLITICVGLLIVYSLYAAELGVIQAEVRVVPAGEMTPQFQALYRATQERALLGKQFDAGPTDDPGAYEFHIYTVQLRNNGLIPADWVRLDLRPETGDILQADSEGAAQLPALSSGEVQLVVLAHQGSTTARQLSLTYFIWSRLYNISIHVQP